MTEKKMRRTVADFLFEDAPNILMSVIGFPFGLSMYCMERAEKSRSRLKSILWGLCMLLLMAMGALLVLGFAILVGRYFYISMPILMYMQYRDLKKWRQLH